MTRRVLVLGGAGVFGSRVARLLAGTRPHRPDGPFRVAGVGRMVEKKGFDVLVEAVPRPPGRGIDVPPAIARDTGAAGGGRGPLAGAPPPR